MPVAFNHTIVFSTDRDAAAQFFTEMFGLPAAKDWGPFKVVELENLASFDFMQAEGDVAWQHYCFLVSEAEFDAIYGRVLDRGLDHWSDPMRGEPNAINHNDGGRGVYFDDPSGHRLEIMTAPHGGWPKP